MNRRETSKRPAIKVFLTVLGLGILCLALYFSLGPGNRLREERETLFEDSSERAGGPQTVAVAGATDGGLEELEDQASVTESYEETESEPATAATGMDSTGPPSEGWLATGHSEVPGKDGSKVSSIIRGVIEELRTRGITRATAQSEEFRARSMKGIIRLDDGGNVQTYIYTEETSEEARETLEALGARIEIVDDEWGIVQAWIPFDQIDRVAGLELVERIEAPDYGFTRTGSATSQGDRILRANLVREAFGFNGAGTTVGVISDGVESRASAQSSSDLPASIEINLDLPGGVEDPEDEGSGDEGTAMLEIIHDLAPEASLAFSGGSDGFPTSLEMVRSIDWLANSAFDGAGVDIIVDDLGFLGEPFFEDGPVARKVKEVVANGTVYVSAAGNDSDEHYEGEFADDGSDFHDFGGGDRTMRVTLEEDGGVFLQWNDRFGSSGNDYDLYGCIEGVAPSQTAVDSGDCIASTAEQDGDDNPKERLINEESSDRILDLYIKKSSGSSRLLEMHFIDATVHEHNVPNGSIYGHPAVPGALAVGAIQADDFGHDTIAPYSSRGPSEIYYPSRETRMKPDIVATDGVSITGAGNFRSLFFGTSAAAPHAAAVAALVLEAIRDDDSTIAKAEAAQQVSNTLLGTAFDLGDTGVDNVYGAGRVDALLAVSGGNEVVYFERPTYAAVESLYTPEVEVKLTAALDEEAVIPITVTNSGAVAADYTIDGLESSAPNFQLRIPANVLSVSFTVTANTDNEDEDGESLTLRIGPSLPAGVIAGKKASAEVDLLDLKDRGNAPGICGRYGPVRDAILHGSDVMIDCDDVTPEELSFITRLSLRGTSITELGRPDLEGMTSLDYLDLSDSQLTTLPSGVFLDLWNLQTLQLNRVQITALPSGVFQGLGNLRELSLEGNPFTTLPGGVFEGLVNLSSLRLSDNKLTTLQVGVFAGLVSLGELHLDRNPLSALPTGVFEGLISLYWLSLTGTPLTNLPAGVFESLISLQSLFLYSNQLTTLPAGVFGGLTNLQELTLERNPLTTLPAGVFEGLTNLPALRLIGHPLTTLQVGVFEGLVNLEMLYLYDNQLTDVPEDLFKDLTNLRGLDLSDNQLTTLPLGLFDGLSKLEWVWVIRNQLTTLPTGLFTGLSNLRALNLFDNQLTDLPAELFEGLSSLEWIHLDQNQLTTLSPGMFEDLSSLIDLNLYGNPLESLPAGAFKGLTSLSDLTLNGYTLTTLPVGVFEGLSSLEELNLVNNQFTNLPVGLFEDLPNLQLLNLSNNQLATVPAGLFAGLSNLIGLSLTGNQFTILPVGLFEGLQSLGRLWLSNNQLTTLSEGLFEGLSGLYYLDLRANQLATLPAGLFKDLSNLETLRLTDNQLTTLPAGIFADLGNLRGLDLLGNQLTTLPPRAFEGLTTLEGLILSGNQLSSLPVGVFEGMISLEVLSLGGNPGAPFTLKLELERMGSGHRSGTVQLRGRMAEGAPFATSATWTAAGDINGTASDSVTIPAGSLVSEPFSLTSADTQGQVSVSLSDPVFTGTVNISGLALAAGDPLALDFAMIPAIGEQFGLNEDIPGMPTGDWTPDLLSRASFSHVGGQTTVMFGPGGRMEEDGDTYTCMSSGGCRIEGTRVSMGTVLVLNTADASGLMVAGLGELVDEKAVFKETTYNGFELKDSTVTTRSVAGETTRVSFLDLDGDLVFVDFSSDDPATEMVITLEEYSGALEGSPYNQPDTQYAQGLATIWIMNPTELTWLSVVSLGNHVDRVDLALVKDDTFAIPVNGMADIRAISIEGDGNIGAIDAANVNFVGSSGEIGIDAVGAVVRRMVLIGDITPGGTARPVLRISGDSLDPSDAAAEGQSVISEIRIAGGDLREATGDQRIDTNGVVYPFPIVAADGALSIRDSDLRPDLGDGHLPTVTDTYVANPDGYFVTDGQTTGAADTAD